MDKSRLEALGLEIAKKKYYNAARVESAIETLDGRVAALSEENRALRERLGELSFGREEIGDAILSAKTISQQMLAEARAEADRLLGESRAEADKLLGESRAEADKLLGEAREARDKTLADCAAREQESVRKVQSCYLQLRELHTGALRRLDSEWQGFLCSLDEAAQQPWREDETVEAEAPAGEPGELARKLSAIAEELRALGGDEEE